MTITSSIRLNEINVKRGISALYTDDDFLIFRYKDAPDWHYVLDHNDIKIRKIHNVIELHKIGEEDALILQYLADSAEENS